MILILSSTEIILPSLQEGVVEGFRLEGKRYTSYWFRRRDAEDEKG
jgi:hypothetical protein